jgi:hypothetical protein
MGLLGVRDERYSRFDRVMGNIWQRRYQAMGFFVGVRHWWITEHTRVSSRHARSRPATLPTQTSVRALGETDLNPVSGLGKVSQLVFAIVQPSNVVANLIAGGAPYYVGPSVGC